jgi:hypothetical protein
MVSRGHNRTVFVLATIVLLAGVFGMQFVGARSLPVLEDAVVEAPGGAKFPVTIPLSDASRPDAAEYRIDATLRFGPLTQGIFRLVPDDCLTGLTINGEEFPLGRFSKKSLCDWENGFDVDLRQYLRRGANAVSIRVRNAQGPWGLQLRAPARGGPLQWLGLGCFLLLVPYVVVSMHALGILGADRRAFWVAVGLVVLGAAVRLAFVFFLHPPESHVYSDMASYVDGARQILAGDRGLHHLFHPVGYPLMLALSLWLTQGLSLAVCLQYLLGVAAFVLVWRGSVPFLRERGALIVLLVGALHFPFISMSGFFLAETGFTFFLALLFYLLARRGFPWGLGYAFAAGVVYMAAAWMKGNDSLFGPILIAWIALRAWRSRARQGPGWWVPAARAAAAFTAGACLVAALTAATTYAVAGRPRISAATGALNFVEGKCPDKINHDLSGSGWHSPLFVQLGERGDKYWPAYFWDQEYFWKAGLSCVRADPWVLATSVRYVYYLFFDNQLWPTNSSEYADLSRWYGMLCSSVLFPGMLVGVLLVSRRPLSGRRPAFLLLASVCVASWLLKSELRYRIPFDVAIIPLSVIGWSWLVRTIFRRRPGASPGAGDVLASGAE